uniref:Uncharacterized protein n=1 Tax=Plectus sambesii TaxID=2011161 RepID=A0A914WKG5_9BILA
MKDDEYEAGRPRRSRRRPLLRRVRRIKNSSALPTSALLAESSLPMRDNCPPATNQNSARWPLEVPDANDLPYRPQPNVIARNDDLEPPPQQGDQRLREVVASTNDWRCRAIRAALTARRPLYVSVIGRSDHSSDTAGASLRKNCRHDEQIAAPTAKNAPTAAAPTKKRPRASSHTHTRSMDSLTSPSSPPLRSQSYDCASCYAEDTPLGRFPPPSNLLHLRIKPIKSLTKTTTTTTPIGSTALLQNNHCRRARSSSAVSQQMDRGNDRSPPPPPPNHSGRKSNFVDDASCDVHACHHGRYAHALTAIEG